VLTVADVQPELVRSGALAGAVRAALRDGQWRGEATLRKRDGRELPVEQILFAHRGPNGAPDYLSTVLRDVTERKQVEVALRDLALVDELTGLYNRRGFMAMAEQEWRRARRGGWPVLAFYGDLDDFKAINDTCGHSEGDAALTAVAALLRGTFREADVLGRPGGDEFTVLVPHADPDSEASVLSRLEERLAAHNAASRRPYALSLSIGVARAEVGDDGSLADLITRADAALYERKRLKPRPARG
jgi:diguanylate cyclase (GGDEF)-like protein